MPVPAFFFDSFSIDRNFLFYGLTQGTSVDATGGRDGGACALLSHNGPRMAVPLTAWTTACKRLIMGFDLKPSTMRCTFVRWFSQGFIQGQLTINDGNWRISVEDADGVQRFLSPAIIGGAWQFLDLIFVSDATGGSIEGIIEGERFFKVEGMKTKHASAPALVDQVWIGDGFIDTYSDIYRVDNLYLMNGDVVGAVPLGRNQNKPHALTGDVQAQLSRSTGSLNYALVDESPPADADYLFPTAPNQRDKYSISAVDDPKSVPLAVRIMGFAKKTDGATRTYRVGLEDAGVSVFTPAAYAGFSTSPTQAVIGARPNGGGEFTIPVIDALRVGPESL